MREMTSDIIPFSNMLCSPHCMVSGELASAAIPWRKGTVLGSVCGKRGNGRPVHVTSEIGNLGMSLWHNLGSCRGLGPKVVISKNRIGGRNWDGWSGNEATVNLELVVWK